MGEVLWVNFWHDGKFSPRLQEQNINEGLRRRMMPDDEANQLRFEFAREIERLKLAA